LDFECNLLFSFHRQNSDFGDRKSVYSNHAFDTATTTVYEDQPLLAPPSPNPMELSDNHHLPPWNTDISDDADYYEIIRQSERAIEGGVLPVRIAAGSSGSYFVRNLEGVCCYSFAT